MSWPSRSAVPTGSSPSTFPSRAGSSTMPVKSGRSPMPSPAEALADAGVAAGELAAVGITNQRETVCVWDPAQRAAAAQRDRLAGPPHGAALRGAERGRARAARARPHRAGARPLLLRHQDRVAARATSRGCASGRSRGELCSARSTRWLDLQAHRRARHRRLQRLAHACCSTSRPARWDPELLDAARHSASARCRASLPARAYWARPDRRRSTASGRRSRASPAISRRRCSARRASSRAWARTPTAPAPSSCSTPASPRRSRRTAC